MNCFHTSGATNCISYPHSDFRESWPYQLQCSWRISCFHTSGGMTCFQVYQDVLQKHDSACCSFGGAWVAACLRWMSCFRIFITMALPVEVVVAQEMFAYHMWYECLPGCFPNSWSDFHTSVVWIAFILTRWSSRIMALPVAEFVPHEFFPYLRWNELLPCVAGCFPESWPYRL